MTSANVIKAFMCIENQNRPYLLYFMVCFIVSTI